MCKSENRQDAREILFRGFHKEENGKQKAFVNGEWHKGIWAEGYLSETTVCGAENVYVTPVIYEKPEPENIFGGGWYEIIRETVGQFTGVYDSTKWDELTKEEKSKFLYPKSGKRRKKSDWKGKPIFEGDIVRYEFIEEYVLCSVVKFGEYEQDGSDGEYLPTKCIGFYVEVINFDCLDDCFYYMKTQNILEVASACKVIGTVYDNLADKKQR